MNTSYQIQTKGNLDVKLPGGASVSADGNLGLIGIILGAGIVIFFIYMKYRIPVNSTAKKHVKKAKGLFKRK